MQPEDDNVDEPKEQPKTYRKPGMLDNLDRGFRVSAPMRKHVVPDAPEPAPVPAAPRKVDTAA
jgi:hypothetical protein